MRYLELCTLSDSQIADLLGLMKELNAELTVTPEMQRRAVGASGTRIFIAENDAKQIVGCATLCVLRRKQTLSHRPSPHLEPLPQGGQRALPGARLRAAGDECLSDEAMSR